MQVSRDAATLCSAGGGAVPLRHPERGCRDRKWPSLLPLFTWSGPEVTREARELRTRRRTESESQAPRGLRDR